MKKIFIITCNSKEHSEKETYVQTYIDEAKKNNHEIRTLNLYDIEINHLNIKQGNALSSDLKNAQDNIVWANQVVFVYPIWWLGIPAIMKSFIENTFQEGIMSEYGKMGPEPLMKDKTAVIMQSYDMPYWCMKYIYFDIPMKWWKIILTNWCGFKIIKRFDFANISQVSEKKKQKWINDIKNFVSKL